LKKQILIVEDERVSAEDIKMGLERLGYSVSGIAVSGDEAVKKAEETRPDLVLMDIVLKGEMDGIEAASAISSRFDIPVVYLTAHADKKTLERVKISEPFGYILKPFEDKELNSILEIALYKHRMERKLKESEEWFFTTLKSIGDAVITMNTQGNITFMNPAAAFLTGWEQKDAIRKPSKNVFNIINEATGKPAGDPVTMVFQEGSMIGLANNTVLIAKDGRKMPVENSCAPIKDKRGNIIGVVLTFRDITERKQIRDALETTKASFHNIVEKNVDGIIIVNKEGIVCFVNRSAEKLFNLTAKEFIGEMFGFPVIAGESTEIDIIRSSGESGTGEMRVVETEWDNKPANLISIRDITERKQMAKIKDDFIAIVSHEIRTPLSIAKEAISLVLDEVQGDINKEQSRILSTAEKNINRLARIINSLLDISKIEAGKFELKKTKVDVASTIRTVASSFESKTKDKGLGLRIEYPEEGVYIYADEDKIIQVLSNLIDNAIKFTSEGSLDISAHENKDIIEYTVADTGIGIPKEDLPNIFDKFKQFGRKEGPGEKGTGLGLSIVKSIVDMHKGKIRVESEVGKGTKFTFSLPKWSSKEMLRQYLSDAISETKEKETYFSMIMISIQNYKELIQDSIERANDILKKMEDISRNALRRSSDKVIACNNREILLILPETKGDDAISVLERIKEELKQFLSQENDLKGIIDLATAVISYPDEVRDEENILNEIRKATYGCKILLIEDEQDQLEMIKIRLEEKGYNVITTRNAENGIELAQEKQPDLILMDMVLPGIHGLEATKKLKEMPETKEIPIVALTAMSIPDFKRACFQEGICDFIRKPYEPAEILEKIEKNRRKKHKRFDETKDPAKKPEEALTESHISIQRSFRPKIEKEKEKVKEGIEFIRVKTPVDEIGLQLKKKITSGMDERKKKDIKEEYEGKEIPKKILIVDDEPDLVKTLSVRLKSCGYQVIAATDAMSGIKQAQKERPDLILLDIMMPAGGGDTVFENLKKSHRTMLIPVILISAFLLPKKLEAKAIELGAEGSISKPFESKELIAKIKKMLG
jgi:PAS domain S-box-containing protein